MASKDPEIQSIYDELENHNIIPINDCECSNEFCINCEKFLETKRNEQGVPFTKEMEAIVCKLLSIKKNFQTNPLKFDEPVSKFRGTNPEEHFWGDLDYQIIFINEGVRISMTKSFIEKIAILNSILLQGNGADKPIRLKHLCPYSGKIYKGPRLYITKLPLESLLFEKIPEDFDVFIYHGQQGQLTTYFKYKNLAEAIYNSLWY
jgi:hypothetical protein